MTASTPRRGALRVLASLSLALLPCGAFAAPPRAGGFPPHAVYDVPMTDGTPLHTEVFTPPGGGDPWPVVLFRTPYGASGWDPSWHTSRGYVTVVQDIRGFHDSGGTFHLFRDDGWGPDHRDGYDTVEWIRAQPWCDGNVASEGNSALGITQDMLAGSVAPGMTCQYVGVAPGDPYLHAIFPGGEFRREDITVWFTAEGYPALVDTVAAHPIDEPWWDWVDVTARIPQIELPTYQVGGWYDLFLQGNIDVFTGLQSGGASGALGNQKLVVGPWTHEYGTTVAGDLTYPGGGLVAAEALVGSREEWFAHWQKGEANGVMDLPPVAYYLMGSSGAGNEWRTAWNWPPPAASTDYYFHADGTMTTTPGGASDPALSFTSDPDDPVPTLGGANLTFEIGPRDQSPVESRSDVLVFTTSVLTETLEVTGPVRVVLHAATDRLDTDFAAKLCDVYPDGRSMIVCDGILKARHRDSFAAEELLVPGVAYEFTIDLWDTAIAFAPGHRIRVSVAGSNYPRYEANPNTGEPFRQHTTTLVATNDLYVDVSRPSRLVLPVTNAPGLGVAVAPPGADAAGPFRLHGVAPNPFADELRIDLEVLRPVELEAAVY
ncbi:CocE/NonD family hydrolase, partial [bacterium]|nr:CocE/NonD family hydrolase [bacterium]